MSSLLLLLFLWFKVIRFQSLYYAFNDMYIFLQASCSWMDGRPLLYENIGGYDDRIHNNYSMLLWGPLIYILGAYGAFMVQIGLYITSYALLFRQFVQSRLPGWINWTLLATMLLGPIWFWFNDHPGIGWHPELTYLPLAILFILALHSARLSLLLVTAALIIAVKEDGALLAGCIHLAYLCLQFLRRNSQRSVLGILTQRHFWVVVGVWAAVFIAGMLLLSYKNNVAEPEPRLQQALDAIAEGVKQPEFAQTHIELIRNVGLLLLPSFLLLLYFLWCFQVPSVGSVLLIYAVAQLAILVSNWVQGATYYGTNPLFALVSLTWPPRFVLMYAFALCYLIAILLLFNRTMRPVATWQQVGLTLGIFLIQMPIAPSARPDFVWSAVLGETFTHQYDPLKQPMLPDADVAVVAKLAQSIPARSNVFVFDYLIPFFHKHYNIWPTDKHWEKADLAVIPINDFQKLEERLPRVMKQPYRVVRLRAYNVYVTPNYEPYLRASLQ